MRVTHSLAEVAEYVRSQEINWITLELEEKSTCLTSQICFSPFYIADARSTNDITTRIHPDQQYRSWIPNTVIFLEPHTCLQFGILQDQKQKTGER